MTAPGKGHVAVSLGLWIPMAYTFTRCEGVVKEKDLVHSEVVRCFFGQRRHIVNKVVDSGRGRVSLPAFRFDGRVADFSEEGVRSGEEGAEVSLRWGASPGR